jgi:hypothetical protein
MLGLPVVLLKSAVSPMAVLLLPVVLPKRALVPMPVLRWAVVLWNTVGRVAEARGDFARLFKTLFS